MVEYFFSIYPQEQIIQKVFIFNQLCLTGEKVSDLRSRHKTLPHNSKIWPHHGYQIWPFSKLTYSIRNHLLYLSNHLHILWTNKKSLTLPQSKGNLFFKGRTIFSDFDHISIFLPKSKVYLLKV